MLKQFVLTICWVLFFDRVMHFFLYRADDIAYLIILCITMIVLAMAAKPDAPESQDNQE